MSIREMRPRLLAAALLLLSTRLIVRAADDPFTLQDPPRLVGRWDVVVQDRDGEYPSWFEIRQSGYRTLVGSYVGRFGSARPIANVQFDNGRMRFKVPPQWEHRTTDVVFEGQLDDGVIRGETTDDDGDPIRWEARRAPSLDRDASVQWGQPIELFNGRDLAGWKPRLAGVRNGWTVKDGLLENAQPGNDLLTEDQYSDFQLHAEFRYPPGSNSGIYLRGRYEVQIEDNFGQVIDSHKIGGVYGFLTPSLNAAQPAGQWQTLEATLIGRRLSVVLNNERIIDRQTIPGITGGALDSNEAAPGPILLQGDHGPIEFRRVTLTPAVER